MITSADLLEKTETAVKKRDLATLQEIFMTLPNKKENMKEREYEAHVKDLFVLLSNMRRDDTRFYQKLLSFPLFEKINEDILKDYSRFNTQIEKKFTQAVTFQYEQTIANLAEMIKDPSFLTLFNEKHKKARWIVELNGLPHKQVIQQILIDIQQGSNAFKLEKTGEFIGFLLGEATFAYQRYEANSYLQRKFKSRQAYLSHVMQDNTMVVQFTYKDPTHRHACIFDKVYVESSTEFYKDKAQRIKERSTLDSVSVCPTRKTIIPFISISSRTLTDSLVTQAEQASRFLTHFKDEEVKRQLVAKALDISVEELSEEEFSQWKVEPQVLDIAPIDEWGKTKKGTKSSSVLLGDASTKNLGAPSPTFHVDKVNYRRELNHTTYLASLFSGVMNDGFVKRNNHGKSTDLIEANYWSIGVDTHEIYTMGQTVRKASTKARKYKLLHTYCTQKLALLLNGLEQTKEYYEVLPEGSLEKINHILTIYHGICGSHGASCSNPINKCDFPDFSSEKNVKQLYSLGHRLIKWLEKYPNGLQTNLELFKEYRNLKSLVGQDEEQFKSNMTAYAPKDFDVLKPKRKRKSV